MQTKVQDKDVLYELIKLQNNFNPAVYNMVYIIVFLYSYIIIHFEMG